MADPAKRARELMAQKADIEEEMEGHHGILKVNNSTTTSPLIDPEGFPRADIDVYQVRHARATLVRLRNDHRAIVEELGRVLEEVYKVGGTSALGGGKIGDGESGGAAGAEGRKPFAKVNTVAAGSPAQESGLQPQDHILSFGTITFAPNSLQAVGALVQRSEGVDIPITVRRGGAEVELVLKPRNGWGGRGSLGCHILPI